MNVAVLKDWVAAMVRLEIRDTCAEVAAGWDFDRVMASNHGMRQVKGIPWGRRPPRKFHKDFTFVTPRG